jgi:uncharacterized protein YdaU (DUF1376 family)
MARKKPPSFDFFPDDFLGGTYHLEAESVGIYVRLLCYQWSNGSIPEDENQLARIAGVDALALRRHMPALMQKFDRTESGGLVNERLEDERQKKIAIIGKAKASAEKRWSKEKQGNQHSEPADPSKVPDAVAMRSHCDGICEGTCECICSGNASYFLLPTSKYNNTSPSSSNAESDVVIPEELQDLWAKWTQHFLEKTGRRMGGPQQEAVLMDLAGRGWDKARSDILFSIRIGAQNVKDSNNDFDKNPGRSGSAGSGSSSTSATRKESAAERMNRLL